MTTSYLVRYTGNWADEMSLHSHTIIDESQYKKLQQALKKKPSFWFSVGTNQEIEYGRHKPASAAITCEKLTEEQNGILHQLRLHKTGNLADYFIESVLENAGDVEKLIPLYIPPYDGHQEDVMFSNFNDAVQFCEQEYQLKGDSWENVKTTKDLRELNDYLQEQGIDCYMEGEM